MNVQTALSHIREVLEGEPSRESWLELCKALQKVEASEEDGLLRDYLAEHARHWPASYRLPPESWRCTDRWWSACCPRPFPSGLSGGALIAGYALIGKDELTWEVLSRLQARVRRWATEFQIPLVCLATAGLYPTLDDREQNPTKLQGDLVFGLVLDGILKKEDNYDYFFEEEEKEDEDSDESTFEFEYFEDDYVSRGTSIDDIHEGLRTISELADGRFLEQVQDFLRQISGRDWELTRTPEPHLVSFGMTCVTRFGFGTLLSMPEDTWEDLDNQVSWDIVSGLEYGDEMLTIAIGGVEIDSTMNDYNSEDTVPALTLNSHESYLHRYEENPVPGELKRDAKAKPAYYLILDTWSGW